MRVRVRHNSYLGRPKEQLLPGASEQSERHYVVGTELDVHAVVVFEGRVQFCVFDRFGDFTGDYAWMFDVLDGAVPRDWIVNCFEGAVSMVVGPEFVAKSVEAYQAFVELVPEAVQKMRERSIGATASEGL
jgi:hypothetical protein